MKKKIKPSALKKQTKALIAAGKMPSLEELTRAIFGRTLRFWCRSSRSKVQS